MSFSHSVAFSSLDTGRNTIELELKAVAIWPTHRGTDFFLLGLQIATSGLSCDVGVC